jgi:cyanuric acid amidohydrolase
MEIKAYKIPTGGPADVSQLEKYINDGVINPSEVICIIGKTEGNGGINDFTRDLAMVTFEDLFSKHLHVSKQEVTNRIIFSLSGGCEGVATPHIIIFTKSGFKSEKRNTHKRLAIGIGFTREFRSEEIGRMAQIEETAAVIKNIVQELQVDSANDVHLVQMKGAIPPYSYKQAAAASLAGKPLRSDMVHSRAASALACVKALQETNIPDLNDNMICTEWDVYSGVASCSAKPGLLRTEIMVFANSPYWQGTLEIKHGILNDMLDVLSIHQVLNELGMNCDKQLSAEQSNRIVGVFAKSEADPRGMIRGRRHTMLSDDDISDTRYSRCVLSSVLASVIGDPAVYVSTRAEHHGPLGGGTLAIIANQGN